MKKLLITAAFLICSLTITFAQFSGSGSGTTSDPFKIFYADQLNQVRNYLNQEGVVFKLMENIDLTSWIASNNPGQGWEPIGVESSPFKGVFDGNGKKLTGFTINRTTNNVGLFGYISGATVNDLIIEGNVVGNSYVGAFVGKCASTDNVLQRLSFTGNVSGNSYVGAIAGRATGTLSDLTVSGEVSGADYVGGLFGSSGSISFVSFNGNVFGTNYVGGLCGYAAGASSCVMSGDITASGQYVGGVAGYSVVGNVSDCRTTGTIQGQTRVGGVCGYLLNSTMSQCYSYCDVTGSGDYIGGIIGEKYSGGNITKCASYGEVSGGNYVGGVLGACQGYGNTYPTLYSYMQFAATAGGTRWLDDKVESISSTTSYSISNCLFSGTLHATGDYVGGISGSVGGGLSWTSTQTSTYIESSHYQMTGVTGDSYYYKKRNQETGESELITTSTSQRIYGKVWTPRLSNYNIKDCYFSGNIEGNSFAGGIVGLMNGGELKNNYSNATTIEGSANVGGIVGRIQQFEDHTTTFGSVVKSNMAINSKVLATSAIGRIYGSISEDGVTVGENSTSEDNRALYDTQIVVSGVTQVINDDAQNGVNNGAAYFKLRGNFVTHGWDFNSNWTNQETESYPYKTWQAAPPTISSDLVSGATSISGTSINGGTVYIKIGNGDEQAVTCSGNFWTLSGISPLKSGESISLYVKTNDKEASYRTQAVVEFPGSGTEADPWRVYTADDLQGVYKPGYYKQMNDISLSSWISVNSSTKGWIPVGFSGTDPIIYDGDNYKVSGLWVNSTEDYVGLFSKFSKGTIRNLTVEATSKQVKGGNYVGIVIGSIGEGIIENVRATGKVSADSKVGGIAGCTKKTTLNKLFYTGQLTVTGGDVGGITGSTSIESVSISECEVKDIIIKSSGTSCIGGLIGRGDNSSTISKCKVSGTITCTGTGNGAFVGGLVALASGSITECSADVVVSSTSPGGATGGLVANYNGGGTITRCYSSGSVTSTGSDANAGGLVAALESGVIEDCYSTANVTGVKWAAGLVAINGSQVNRCYASGNVASTYYGAGLVCRNTGTNAIVTNSVALNEEVVVTDASGWGLRVIGGYDNGAPDPDESNFAWVGMQVSVNGVPKQINDNILEGQSLTTEETKNQNSYEALCWNFDEVWTMPTDDYPILKWQIPASIPATGISLDNATLNLTAAGQTATLTATVTPEDATDKTVTWTSSNTAVATVNNNGLVTAVGDGTTTITATTNDGTNLTATCEVTIVTAVSGDANSDGTVNVTDYLAIANYILGTNTANFNETAADVNTDGTVNVSDYVGVANIILYGNYQGPSVDGVMALNSGETSTWMEMESIGDGKMNLLLHDAKPFSAFQMDVQLPEGVEIVEASMAKANQTKNLGFTKLQNGTWRLLYGTLENEAINLESDNLLTLELAGRKPNTGGLVGIDQILLVKNNTSTIKLDAVQGGMPTGINSIVSSSSINGDCYDLTGRKVDISQLKKGVYVVNGKKLYVK